MAVYRESEDLINIGAYKRGTNKKLDKAIDVKDLIDEFLTQETLATYPMEETISMMEEINLKIGES